MNTEAQAIGNFAVGSFLFLLLFVPRNLLG